MRGVMGFRVQQLVFIVVIHLGRMTSITKRRPPCGCVLW